jgi:hypothetical protein
MAYTDVWDVTAPLDSQAAAQGAADFRATKLDVMQRIASFGAGLLAARPTPETTGATADWTGVTYLATDTRQLFRWDGTAWVDISADTPTGAPIPTLTQKQGSAGGSYTTSSNTPVDVDAVKLAYTVNIPVGWKLLIAASGSFLSLGSAFTEFLVSLFDTAPAVTLIKQGAQSSTSGAGQPQGAFALNWVITGDGLSHTVKLQFNRSGSGACSIQNSAGDFPVMTFVLTPSN